MQGVRGGETGDVCWILVCLKMENMNDLRIFSRKTAFFTLFGSVIIKRKIRILFRKMHRKERFSALEHYFLKFERYYLKNVSIDVISRKNI